jgi:hypothetical protein
MTVKDHEFMFEAIEKVRKTNEARRTIKEQLLADMGLASVQQLSPTKRIMLEERIDAILVEKDKETVLKEAKGNLKEISKSTLASYIPKAHASGTAAAADQENAFVRGTKRNWEKFKRAGVTGEKREKGIKMAARKLAREEK